MFWVTYACSISCSSWEVCPIPRGLTLEINTCMPYSHNFFFRLRVNSLKFIDSNKPRHFFRMNPKNNGRTLPNSEKIHQPSHTKESTEKHTEKITEKKPKKHPKNIETPIFKTTEYCNSRINAIFTITQFTISQVPETKSHWSTCKTVLFFINFDETQEILSKQKSVYNKWKLCLKNVKKW